MPHHFSHDPPSEVRGPVSLPRMLRLVPRRNTQGGYQVGYIPHHRKTIPRLLGELARGLNGAVHSGSVTVRVRRL